MTQNAAAIEFAILAEGDRLQIERTLLHRAIASSQNGITIARASDGEFPLIYANPAFYAMSGFTPEEVLGNDCRFLQRGQSDQAGLVTLRQALAEGRQATVLLLNYRKDGSEFWNELTVSPIFGEEGVLTHYVGLQHDVSERERDGRVIAELNRALTQHAEELQLANEGLRSFSSSASHDLRAPLASIKGFAAALRKSIDVPPDSRANHYLRRIDANTERMEKLIEALLDLAQSSARPLNPTHCDLSAMGHDVVRAYLADAPGLATKVTIEPDLKAHGDAALLNSVLQNLLGNALKYSSKTPEAKVHFGQEGHPVSKHADDCNCGRFFVRDNGAGFDMAYASNLFGTFQRLHSEDEFSGTGLGLAIVRRIIMRHGGQISAEAAPGKGAVFYFMLAPAIGVSSSSPG